MISFGPIIVGLIFGLVIGYSFRKSEYFNYSSLLAIFLLLIVVAVLEGSFPFYAHMPISVGFLAASVGLILGKVLFGRKDNSKKDS